uniref:Uncharacterized protein yfaD n=1 Tax=Anthurium amnicola TaxID=1678845 RepID=A0A1D1YN31_9ARAE
MESLKAAFHLNNIGSCEWLDDGSSCVSISDSTGSRQLSIVTCVMHLPLPLVLLLNMVKMTLQIRKVLFQRRLIFLRYLWKRDESDGDGTPNLVIQYHRSWPQWTSYHLSQARSQLEPL